MYKFGFVVACCFGVASSLWAKTFYAKDYGIAPEGNFTAADVSRLMTDVQASKEANLLLFEPGHYRLTEAQSQQRTWFISNHDQTNPRRVFLPIENQKDLTVHAHGVTLEAEVPMIFVGIWESQSIAVTDMTCDYVSPLIAQLDIVAVDAAARTVTFKPLPEVKVSLEADHKPLVVRAPDASFTPTFGILFEADGKIAYRTGDFGFRLNNVTANGDGTYTSHNFAHPALKVGQHMAVRPGLRPAPGIVISDSKDVVLEKINVHYADGMACLAQSTENIVLQNFNVIPNSAKGRFFSTQADATHFSGCKGTILSKDGTYIGMMDDAINVHGTYLRVMKRVDERTLEGQYMHHQAYGFTWGEPGDKISFIRSQTMEALPTYATLETITPLDKPTTQAGAKRFRLTFKETLPETLDPSREAFGIENLTWTPEVHFTNNLIKDNRARGALFSTPKRVVCMQNIFDHVSGCGVLLCGDCNGWYETGACTDVTIAENRFINNLTSPFQFTEAVISICPEIPNLNGQTKPLHQNIEIRDNIFETFDKPLIYAKSVDGLGIRGNVVRENKDFKPFLSHREWLTTVKCTNVVVVEPPTKIDWKDVEDNTSTTK